MKFTIEADIKEFAALVKELQEQQSHEVYVDGLPVSVVVASSNFRSSDSCSR